MGLKKNQTKELLDLALHPVRMRILMLLSGTQGMTPQQMAEQMSDVPQATLYRHINRLAQGGVLAVVAERPVRGTLEKVYALSTVQTGGSLEQFNQLSKTDHQRYFTTYVLSLLDDFSRYLWRSGDGHIDMAADGVGYHKLALFLSDAELIEFSVALNQALAPFLGLKNAPGRKKRLFATIMMPAGDSPEPGDDDGMEEKEA